MFKNKCNYCKGKRWHSTYIGGDGWTTTPCHKCNPGSPWYQKTGSKK